MSHLRSTSLRLAASAIAFCLALQPGAMLAQNVTWSAPAGGFIFDRLTGSIRPVSGFVGAAVLGSAIRTGFDWAAIAPNQKSALAARKTGLLWIPDLSAPDRAQSLDWISGAKQAIWSTDSTRVAVLARGQIVWLSTSNSAVSVEQTSPLPLSTGSVRARFAEISILAADTAANGVLLTSHNLAAPQLWFVSETVSASSLPFDGVADAAAFSAHSDSLFLADAANHRIVQIRNPAAAATLFPIVTSAELLASPAGVALSPDDSHLFVADRLARVVREFDASTGALIQNLDADTPAAFLTLFTPGRFLLDAGQSGQPFLFLDTADPARLTFIPRPN